MDIAKLSMAMSQTYVKEQFSVGLMRKTLDQAELQSDQMLRMLEQAPHPHLGTEIDLSV